MANFIPIKNTKSVLLALPIKEGQWLCSTDSAQQWLDVNNTTRIEMNPVVNGLNGVRGQRIWTLTANLTTFPTTTYMLNDLFLNVGTANITIGNLTNMPRMQLVEWTSGTNTCTDRGNIQFIPNIVTKTVTTETLTLVAGTYYDYTNAVTSLTLTVPDSIYPTVVWFKTGATVATITLSGTGILIPKDGIEIEANMMYELSIIKKRVGLLTLKSL